MQEAQESFNIAVWIAKVKAFTIREWLVVATCALILIGPSLFKKNPTAAPAKTVAPPGPDPIRKPRRRPTQKRPASKRKPPRKTRRR